MTSTRRREAPLAPGAGISTRSSRGSRWSSRCFQPNIFLSSFLIVPPAELSFTHTKRVELYRRVRKANFRLSNASEHHARILTPAPQPPRSSHASSEH